MIPRVGQTWVIRRGKTKRKVRIVIAYITSRRRDNGSRSYVIHYRTDGTWAAHGMRSLWLKPFLKMTVPQ